MYVLLHNKKCTITSSPFFQERILVNSTVNIGENTIILVNSQKNINGDIKMHGLII